MDTPIGAAKDFAGFKPMLASPAPEDLSKLKFPVLASPKLDGIRCVKLGGRALSRKLKPIPNNYVRGWIEKNLPDGVDGELMLVGPEQVIEGRILTSSVKPLLNTFNDVQSAIMSVDGEPDFVFCVFDQLRSEPTKPFLERFQDLGGPWCSLERVRVVQHKLIHTVEELQVFAATCVGAGFEGAMIRDPKGPYKFGRSTEKEGFLLKLKTFVDEEAVVLGVVEEMENQNEAVKNELGQTKRSSAKAGKVGKGRLGALRCVFEDGTEFEVGSGFTDEMRAKLWADRSYLQGSNCSPVIVTIKHQPAPGGRRPGEAPRFPVFKGFRCD